MIVAAAGVLRGQERGAAALGPLVSSLGVTMRVLVIGAHPDDEDTNLIAWLTKGRGVETAYLSLTRGDGGQNIIGNELGEALGAIRTEELLAARRLDGGKQYFTRAYDYGFSKNTEEAYSQWPHDSILRDVLTVVRAFRPHVIVSVFSGTPSDGHGQHQVAGLVAREAYDAGADTLRFPRSATAGLGGWTVSKFYRGAFFRNQDRATIRMNVGEYDPVLGRSYAEIASDSRSQHKSQAMGSLQPKGARFDQLVREAVRVPAPEDAKAERTIFDGIDTTWARFRPVVTQPDRRAALDSLSAAIAEARGQLNVFAPDGAVPSLARVVRLLDRVCVPLPQGDCYEGMRRDSAGRLVARDGDLVSTVTVARGRANDALALALGVAIEATAPHEVWAVGDSVPMQLTVYNRGARTVTLVGNQVGESGFAFDRAGPADDLLLRPDSTFQLRLAQPIARVTSPWWLASPRSGAMFTRPVFGVAEGEAGSILHARIALRAEGARFTVSAPVGYRYADQVRGERNIPAVAAPAISVLLDRDVEYATANASIQRTLRVHVRSAASTERDVRVSLKLPAGLVADSAARSVKLPAGAARTVTFAVRGRLPAGRHIVQAVASSNGDEFSQGYTAIEYEHIRTQRLYRQSTLAIEAVDLRVPAGLSVAYVNGVGDNIAPMLEQLGVSVTVLDPATIARTDLSRFGAVVVGTRAYEASPDLVANNASLLAYARNGGTMVVQYGQYEMLGAGIMPYPITLGRPADRVTMENSPVRVLDPAASVLSVPNKIGESDFAGWLQDRSLYMPRTFDPAYVPSLEMNDPGETPNRGGILVAPYGKGTYVYTSLAFFRQLPNGVPGAARLFVNLLAAKTPRVQP